MQKIYCQFETKQKTFLCSISNFDLNKNSRKKIFTDHPINHQFVYVCKTR